MVSECSSLMEQRFFTEYLLDSGRLSLAALQEVCQRWGHRYPHTDFSSLEAWEDMMTSRSDLYKLLCFENAQQKLEALTFQNFQLELTTPKTNR